MNKNVPAEYTVEFGQKVADSFIWLGGFVDKTEFRLHHLEKHLGEALAQVEELQKVVAITAKEVTRPKGRLKTALALGAGVFIGSKLAQRGVRDKIKQAYSEAASRVEDAVKEMQADVTAPTQSESEQL